MSLTQEQREEVERLKDATKYVEQVMTALGYAKRILKQGTGSESSVAAWKGRAKRALTSALDALD